jgi:hypothetical protein
MNSAAVPLQTAFAAEQFPLLFRCTRVAGDQSQVTDNK